MISPGETLCTSFRHYASSMSAASSASRGVEA
jgi:hypothetical protein